MTFSLHGAQLGTPATPADQAATNGRAHHPPPRRCRPTEQCVPTCFETCGVLLVPSFARADRDGRDRPQRSGYAPQVADRASSVAVDPAELVDADGDLRELVLRQRPQTVLVWPGTITASIRFREKALLSSDFGCVVWTVSARLRPLVGLSG